jgi:hypothetical protein
MEPDHQNHTDRWCFQFRKGSTIMASRALKIDPKKALTSEPDVQVDHSPDVDESLIAARAYELWQAR